MDGIGPEQLNIQALVKRVTQQQIQEIILAINPSVEGETTTLYIGNLLKPFTRVTRIAFGLPMGGDLEYADEVTLARALEGRRELDQEVVSERIPKQVRETTLPDKTTSLHYRYQEKHTEGERACSRQSVSVYVVTLRKIIYSFVV